MKKLTAILLIIMMMATYLITLGNVVIAVSENLLEQTSKTNHANVEMNSYFTGESHSQTFEIGKEAKVFFRVKVNNTGYLKNTTIELIDSNYEFVTEGFANEKVQSITSNTIKVKQINEGDEGLLLEVPIQIAKAEEVVADLLNKISKVKITGTYIDGNGKEKKIEKEINQEVKWTNSAEIELAGEMSKYIPYHEKEEYGVMMQAKVSSNIKENKLPVKDTKIEVTLPKIAIEANSVKPERVSVVANTTMGTNGINNGDSFKVENYHYDEEANTIVIETRNEANSEGKIAWKEGRDEYVVTYTFVGKEVYDMINKQLEEASKGKVTEEERKAGKENEKAITGELLVKADIETYQEGYKLEKEGKITYSIEEKIGDIVDFSISSTNSISKGYIYANYAKEEKKVTKEIIEDKKDTDYEVNYTAKIYDKEMPNFIEFETVEEKYIDEKEEEHSGKVNYSKIVKVNEEIFKKILGEEGKIEINSKKGEKLGEITVETAKDEDGNYSINISENKVNDILIKTSNIITEGEFNVTVQKAISAQQNYTKEDMESFKKMTTGGNIKGYAVAQEQVMEVNNSSKTSEIELIEPVSKAEISIEGGKQNLSTAIVNKDVNIKVVLDTSSADNALYKNPVIEIQMPTQVKKVDIKSANLFLDDELKIKETKVITQNNRQIIKITLEGTQTKYYGTNKQTQENVIAKGANIVLNTDITVDQLAPSKTAQILMYYINENSKLYENTYQPKVRAMSEDEVAIGMAKTNINLVAQNGIVAANAISNYAEGEEDILTVSDNVTNANIAIYTEKRIATVTAKIINNYANKITDMVILGRFPAKDNQKIDTTESLGSTFNTPLSKAIELTGIDASYYTIYYSNKANASKDLNVIDNGWTTTASTDAKSYMIVTKNYEMESGKEIDFSYQIEIPENLAYNNSSSEMYKIYYNNVASVGTMAETKVSPIIKLTTGVGPNVEIKLTSNMPNDESSEEVKLLPNKGAARFWLEVKNVGEMAATNAVLRINTPANTSVASYNEKTGTYILDNKIIEIGTLKAGEQKQISYYLLSSNVKNEHSLGEIVKTGVSLTADNVKGAIKSNEIALKILPAQFAIINKTNTEETNLYSSKDIITYEIKLKDNTEGACNVTVNVPLPENVNILEAYWNEGDKNAGIEKKSNQVIAKSSFSGDEKNLTVKFQLKSDAKTSFSTKVFATVEATEDHEEEPVIGQIYSNEQYIYIDKPELNGNQKLPDKVYVKEAEEFYYNFVITSSEKGSHTNFVLEDILPSEVKVLDTQVDIQNKEDLSYGQMETVKQEGNKLTITIPKVYRNSTINIKIKVRATLNSKQEDGKQIINKASIYSDQVAKVELNSVKQYLEYDEKVHQNAITGDAVNESKNGRYKITGTAWLDSNKNGNKEETEELLSGIKVLLIYKANSNVVRDVDTNEQKIVTTNANGQYEFKNIEKGEYLVIFLYDASKYNVTTYQAEGVSESYNSDAINMKITLDQEQRYAGVSDIIKVQTSNVRDIDIGLYQAEKFDLRLDKYISKITITTPSSGTKVYNYKDAKMTKREIASKDVNSSSAIVEYKIVVTNEGQVAGYARKIADYLPQTSKFNSETNKEWYLSNDQKSIYNTSIAETILQPGESKELSLVLTFNINDKNIGKVIENKAEIYESYNEQGLTDFDSESANQIETEDDMSLATIIFSIATGTIILYISLGVAVIIMIGIGIFEIKKRVIKNK